MLYSDKEILEAVNSKDKKLYKRLYDVYYVSLCRYASKLLHREFDGEEEDVVAGIAERKATAFGNAEGLGEFDGLEGGGGKEVVGAAIDLGIVETLAQGFADVAVVEGAFVDAELDFLEPDAVPEVDAEGAPGGEVADVGAVGVEEVDAGTEGIV